MSPSGRSHTRLVGVVRLARFQTIPSRLAPFVFASTAPRSWARARGVYAERALEEEKWCNRRLAVGEAVVRSLRREIDGPAIEELYAEAIAIGVAASVM